MLEIHHLHAYYGRSHVLQGVSLSVQPGEVVALLGRNGAGKTTTFRAVAGLIRQVSGSVRLDSREWVGRPTHEIARAGIVYVPSGRRSFAGLTVKEHLQIALGGRTSSKTTSRVRPPAGSGEFGRSGKGEPRAVATAESSDAWTRVFEMFPALERKLDVPAGVLSGGENQMLKMACAFLTEPRVLLLDEPTEGLAPIVVRELGDRIRALADAGVGVLLAEQNARFAFSLSKRAYVMHKGVVQVSGWVDDLVHDETVSSHLGI
ncbi:MAG: ABC transporter ATP-binding protein [Alicyclobacillus macrosporangiidus]|uniref:ABC transporter ATP-binding protein n=1 Tax=Alicyclobacillus macrosporangiidus TaxID=392015 RepID=UPI0026EC0FCE|nr:ABC transporter ATP-binding protein [Alicyclobacillus macrosporangiidus]MCL6599171.1 ABC transporter ATP-binding protein [Alicyclobacillus macrosporangiidus]